MTKIYVTESVSASEGPIPGKLVELDGEKIGEIAGLTAGRVMFVGANGAPSDSAGALLDATGLLKLRAVRGASGSHLELGGGGTGNSGRLVFNRAQDGAFGADIGFFSASDQYEFRFYNGSAPDNRMTWWIRNGVTPVEAMRLHPSTGLSIGTTVDPGAGGLNLSGNLKTGGVQRLSSVGRIDGTSIYNSAQAGGGVRPLLTDNAGMQYATDPATFRGVIGAATSANGSNLPATEIKAETNNLWTNTGPSTPIYSSYRRVTWAGNKLYSEDGSELYGVISAGDTGEAASNIHLSAYPAVTLSGADLQISRDMAAHFGGAYGKPFFLGNGVKFGDGGGILFFPHNDGYGLTFSELATGFGAARVTGGGALIATTVTDDTDEGHTQAVATWCDDRFEFHVPIRYRGAQVVGARKTGWATATGTATRTTFATSTVTTAQLAERVKALIDDLISHGLIGA